MPPSPAGPLNFTVPYVRVQAMLICKNYGVTVPKASALGRGSGSLAPHWKARWANEDELRLICGGFKVGEWSFVPATGMKFGAVFTCNTT